MKKGDILTGTVLRTEFPNKGILYIDNRKVIVKNALEGQTIRLSISKKKKERMEGRLLEVLESSPGELPQPACIHFGQCGGCAYQNLPYELQLDLKKRQVEALIRQSGFDFKVEAIYGSPITEGYRNKMEFTFGDEEKGGPLALGMHKKNSFYDIVPLTDCRIADPDFNVLLQTILSYFQREKKTFYHRMKHKGFLRHLVLRRSVKTGDILINLVTTSQDTLDENGFVKTVLSTENIAGFFDQMDNSDTDTASASNRTNNPSVEKDRINIGLGHHIDGHIVGILHTINDSLADVVQSDETRILYGQDYLNEYLFNIKFKISPFSFFQTNTLSAEVLYSRVREYVGETTDKLIYDLYSGTGTIAQILAPFARKVVGVEIVEEAVEAAKQNAKVNGLTNCEFIAGDVLKVVDELTEKPDVIVLDPPRDGINPKALRKIIRFGVKEMIYVSCKPTSLMRDLVMLQEAGYEVKRCCLVDQFPATAHTEAVALLSHKEPDSHTHVKMEFGEG